MDEPVAVEERSGEAKRELPRKGWFFHPYTQLSVSIVMAAAAQLCMKKGSNSTTVPTIWLGIEGLRSGWIWLCILALVGGLFSWLYSLRFVPLNIAFNLAGFTQVLVPLGCWLLLGERIGPTRLCGIVLVCAGVFIVAKPLMSLEEKL